MHSHVYIPLEKHRIEVPNPMNEILTYAHLLFGPSNRIWSLQGQNTFVTQCIKKLNCNTRHVNNFLFKTHMIVIYVGWEERGFRHQKQAQLRWLSDKTPENVLIKATEIKCQVHTLFSLYFVIHTLYYDTFKVVVWNSCYSSTCRFGWHYSKPIFGREIVKSEWSL